MDAQHPVNVKIRIGFRDPGGLLPAYIRDRIVGRVKSVWLILVYLILFQTLVLQIGVSEATVITLGIALVVIGFALVMKGRLLGPRPLGYRGRLKLPQKSTPPTVWIFALLSGFLATLAELSIQILQTTGPSVKAWEAPLFYLMLTKHSQILVVAVGIGVGVAVVLGMFRFYRSWSLKPLIHRLATTVVGFPARSFSDRNTIRLTGLAWDCGAVTTGPVTVPLVLALGIGISRVAVSEDRISPIPDALKKAEAFTHTCHGRVQLRRISRAFTDSPK